MNPKGAFYTLFDGACHIRFAGLCGQRIARCELRC